MKAKRIVATYWLNIELKVLKTHFIHSDLSGDDDVYVSDNDELEDLASNEESKKIGQDHGDKSEDKVNNNGTSAVPSQVYIATILGRSDSI